MAPKKNSVPLFDLSLSPQDKATVKAALDSGWLTTGPMCAELEKLTCKQTNARHSVAVNSATAGLELALKALGIGAGDHVVAPSYTFVATIAAIRRVGATPVLADIDENSLSVSPDSVQDLLTNKTKALISVDFAGLPCDYSELRSIARLGTIKFISDAAHSQGSMYKGKPVGAQADVTVFSLYSTKNVTAGEGGLVVTNTKSLADKVRSLSLHGITSPTHLRNRSGTWRYDVSEIGMKANLADLNAALALSRARRLESLLAKRKAKADLYMRLLKSYESHIKLPKHYSERQRAWHLFVIRLNLERWKISRDRFISEMGKLGVGCGVHYVPVHHFSAFKTELGKYAKLLPVTEKVWREVVTLPLYPELTSIQIRYIADTIGTLIKRFGR